MKEYIKYMEDNGYWDIDGKPLKCDGCEGTDIDEIPTDILDGHLVCEKKAVCKNCGKQVGYWSYGHWQV